MIKLRTKIEQYKEDDFLTDKAKKIVTTSIESMVKKLIELGDVEVCYFGKNDPDNSFVGFNDDTSFRESFQEFVENELQYFSRKLL